MPRAERARLALARALRQSRPKRNRTPSKRLSHTPETITSEKRKRRRPLIRRSPVQKEVEVPDTSRVTRTRRRTATRSSSDVTENGNEKLPVVMLERLDEILTNGDAKPKTRASVKAKSKLKNGAKSEMETGADEMARPEVMREIKKDMTDKWSDLVSLMTRYEGYLRESEGGRSKGATEADTIRMRVENEEMKIKIKVIENKWKSFKDEAIKNEVKLQRRIKQLENSNQRLKDTMEKMKTDTPSRPKPPPAKRKRVEPPSEEEEDEFDDDASESSGPTEKFGNVRVVTNPERLRFHQDAIINGKRRRKPKFSHLQGEYAIDMKGMDKKMLDQDDDVAGVGSPDEGEEEDDEGYACPECEKIFNDDSSLRTHLKDLHGVLNPDAKFSCERCNILLTSPVAYNRHMKYLHGQDEKPFTCGVCHVAFATQQNLQSHIDNKVHEKKGIVVMGPDGPEEPGEKTVNLGKQIIAKTGETGPDGKEKTMAVNVVKASVPNRSGVKRNICPLCFMIFPTSTAMNEHMKKHKQVKPETTFACEYCEEVFFKKQALLDHEAKCPKNKISDDKLWDAIDFPEASQVLEDQANYKDESLIDPELGPTADLQEAVAQSIPEPVPVSGPIKVTQDTDMDMATPMETGETGEVDVNVAQQSVEGVEASAETPQYETVSIVDESGQPLGQAQVSVDPVTGAVTYVALGQNGEQLPLSQVLEGGDTSELLLSIINQANNANAKDS